MGKYFLIPTFIFIILLSSHPLHAKDGFSGTLYFQQGKSVKFEHLGLKNALNIYSIRGVMGGQKVTINLSEIKEVIFADQSCYYDGKEKGEVVVVNRQGERFTIQDAYLQEKRENYSDRSGIIHYVYNDPVTKMRKQTYGIPGEDISGVKIGEHVGDIKLNPKTGDYFPSMYVYDPFTGHKLIWSKQQ